MFITISTIPHAEQRYKTVGDWQWVDKENTDLIITISDMKHWKYNFLVAFHEQIEVMLCKMRGISQKEVDDFDIEFEKNRKEGDFSEPGDDPKAPYYHEHQFASKLEEEMAKELNVNWEEYNEAVNSL